MFKRVFVEEELRGTSRVEQILAQLRYPPTKYIERIDEVFGAVKKPYLHKRSDLQLFLGKKRGQTVKVAPAAYGTPLAPHYYFVHAYNCIYECEYCYLQGYFNSPDIVLFLNHEEILAEIERLCNEVHAEEKEVWFHAGEFSDSLALGNLGNEWPLYWERFSSLKNGFLELRTKAGNIRSIEGLAAQPNIVPSFSLASASQIQKFDRKAAPLESRLKAIGKLAGLGYDVGIHLDPIIFTEDLVPDYQQLLSQLCGVIAPEKVRYVSLGTVRFPRGGLSQIKRNYPESQLLVQDFVSKENPRYPKPLRLNILNRIRKLCLDCGIAERKIYLCMESP